MMKQNKINEKKISLMILPYLYDAVVAVHQYWLMNYYPNIIKRKKPKIIEIIEQKKKNKAKNKITQNGQDAKKNNNK
ncbi:hypothetical protein DERF_014910 [Dermatophagoides farinae]|uniref:Uncharacterized protein n=1 Tax=Dermatophagoides farinae TaxID=6954 RepID=A0A922KZP9_DERFA|nr:hypothetical protein DERF_014910 [Dermatophagoides farinae]